ncbi:hypothetical protein GCM10022244_30780 [Streptomyces gulbargensis]|uniref:DUF642 domain-containing protein n=1 Tax=Streptomyces gulbargensis TaxID=364901 RepID=A0ABP7MEZ8_9ACTN
MNRTARKAGLITLVLAAALTGLATGAPQVTAASGGHNLITNGSFNQPTAPEGPHGYTRIDSSNDHLLPGWDVVRGDIDIYNRDLAQSPKRNQAADLTGSQPGTIRQTIETVPGKEYAIRWQHSRETFPGCDRFPEQPYEVTVIGNTSGRFEPQGDAGDWLKTGMRFTASDDTENIQFASKSSAGNGGCGAMITDVTVTALTSSGENNNGGGGGDD